MKKWIVLMAVVLASCKTVGVSMTRGGYAEVSPQIASGRRHQVPGCLGA